MAEKNIIQKVVLGGLVIKDNKILILQRNADDEVYPNLWELPSGKKEPLETYDVALIREVEEESGLKVKIIVPVSVFNYQVEKPTEIRDSTQINFLVKPLNDDVTLSSEHQAIAWIGQEDIEEYNLSELTREAIRKGFEIARHLDLK